MDHHFGLLAGGLAGLDWPAEFNPLVWGFLAIVAIAVGYVLLRNAVRDGVYAALRMHDGARPRARDRGVARLGALLILSAAALLAATAARAGEPRSLEQRVAELEARVAQLEAVGAQRPGPHALGEAERAALISLGKAFRLVVTLEQENPILTRFMPPERMVRLQEIDAKATGGVYAPAWPSGVAVLSTVQDLALMVRTAHLQGLTRRHQFQDRLFPWTARLAHALEVGNLEGAWQAKQQIELIVPRAR